MGGLREDIQVILTALHNVMKKVGYVTKDGRNDFHGYRYASEAGLLEKLRPAMIEEGLILIPSGVEQRPIDENGNTQVTVAYTLAHTSGAVWPDKIIAFGCGNDRDKSGKCGDKGVFKALTGANKYILFKLFQIETGDDPEREEEATHKQVVSRGGPPSLEDALTDMSKAPNMDSLRERFLEYSKLPYWSTDDRQQITDAKDIRKQQLNSATAEKKA